MANLATEMCGLIFKNPIISASDDFGGSARMAKRAIEQGAAGIVTKTIHQIPGAERWPRPYHFPLRRFGRGFEDTMLGLSMFSHIPYDEWMKEEGPAMRKVCQENNVRFIVSISGIGENLDSWKKLAHDQEAIGAEMLELNLGGPHATFGAEEAAKEAGAPIGIDPEKAYKVTHAVVDAVSIPVSCKMTPISDISRVALACEQAGAAAISANNSCYGIFIDTETGTCYGAPCSGGGGMGRGWIVWSLAKTIEVIKAVNIPVSGMGGVFTHEDVVRYIMAGCPTVQVATATYIEGVGVIKKLVEGLNKFMGRKGYKSIRDFLGIALRDVIYIRDLPREGRITVPSPIRPEFDMSLCKPCDICERLCPYGAITRDGKNKISVNEEYCMGCGFCVGICPRDAIKLMHVDTGEVIWDGRGMYKQWVKR